MNSSILLLLLLHASWALSFEFDVCIDDTDCKKNMSDPADFRCFAYLCYPWKDSDILPEEFRLPTCERDEDCPPRQKQCVRYVHVRDSVV